MNTLARYKEERTWVGLGSTGFVLVDEKDTNLLCCEESLVGYVGWVGKQGPDW